MTSQAKTKANRKNALRSTGPRTPSGKACSALNRLTHGLRSATVTIPGEDPSEWDQFRGGIIGSLSPASPLEEELAHRAAVCLWRVRRCGALEAIHTSIEQNLANAPAFRDRDDIESAEREVEDAERSLGWRQSDLDRLHGASPLTGLMDLPDTERLAGERVDDMFAEFVNVGDTDFDYHRRKFLVAAGLPESATEQPFDWDGWTAGPVRKGLGIIAKNQRLELPAVIAEAVSGREARRRAARESVAEAEREVERARDAVRLVEARHLLAVLIPTDDVVGLLHRYESHHFRQMTEAINTLHRLQRAKAGRSGTDSRTDDDTD